MDTPTLERRCLGCANGCSTQCRRTGRVATAPGGALPLTPYPAGDVATRTCDQDDSRRPLARRTGGASRNHAS